MELMRNTWGRGTCSAGTTAVMCWENTFEEWEVIRLRGT